MPGKNRIRHRNNNNNNEEINQYVIERLIQQIDELSLNQAELREENRRLKRRVGDLNTQNVLLEERITVLENTTDTSRWWPCVGDRVRVHRPTLPADYPRQHIIEGDRLGTVDDVDSVWVYFTTDSGIERYRQPQNLTIINDN